MKKSLNDRINPSTWILIATVIGGFILTWGKVQVSVSQMEQVVAVHDNVIRRLGTSEDPLFPIVDKRNKDLADSIEEVKSALSSFQQEQRAVNAEMLRGISVIKGQIGAR